MLDTSLDVLIVFFLNHKRKFNLRQNHIYLWLRNHSSIVQSRISFYEITAIFTVCIVCITG